MTKSLNVFKRKTIYGAVFDSSYSTCRFGTNSELYSLYKDAISSKAGTSNTDAGYKDGDCCKVQLSAKKEEELASGDGFRILKITCLHWECQDGKKKQDIEKCGGKLF